MDNIARGSFEYLRSMLSAIDIRNRLKEVAEAHPAGVTFYTVPNTAKDEVTEPSYPLVAMETPRIRMRDNDLYTERYFDCKVLVVSQNASDRLAEEAAQEHSDSEVMAADIFLELKGRYRNSMEATGYDASVVMDEATRLEVGVLLRFTVRDLQPACTGVTFTY